MKPEGVTVHVAPVTVTWFAVTCPGQGMPVVVLARGVLVYGYLSGPGCHSTGYTLYPDMGCHDVLGPRQGGPGPGCPCLRLSIRATRPTGCTLYRVQGALAPFTMTWSVTCLGQDGVVLARGVRVNCSLVLSLPRALHKMGLFQRPLA